jgi:hypothetical protein
MARSISTNVSNNPLMTKHEHGSGDFYADMAAKRLRAIAITYRRAFSLSIRRGCRSAADRAYHLS